MSYDDIRTDIALTILDLEWTDIPKFVKAYLSKDNGIYRIAIESNAVSDYYKNEETRKTKFPQSYALDNDGPWLDTLMQRPDFIESKICRFENTSLFMYFELPEPFYSLYAECDKGAPYSLFHDAVDALKDSRNPRVGWFKQQLNNIKEFIKEVF